MQLDTHCFRWSHGPRVDSDQIVPLSGLSYVCRPEITDSASVVHADAGVLMMVMTVTVMTVMMLVMTTMMMLDKNVGYLWSNQDIRCELVQHG